ncbi:hypothetical protein DM01DRAFT_1165200 [Hesseltinella vesiculosa]|uniref:RPEL repeat protein n=1 Tax=Hesseltinella vesiculosa TaxID=101127 RepID=A0A1X2GT77_9FUNG|nr:hypothetical protein DM01DRAFT_1165200 [Hesseltinella vesiculosa]
MTVTENPLETFLVSRPDVQDLVEKNILKDPAVAPALQSHREELNKRKVEDSLRHKIDHRPTPEALFKQNILTNMSVAPAMQNPADEGKKILHENLEKKIADRPTKGHLVDQGILQE